MGTSHTTADYLFQRRFPSISSACVSILRRKYASRAAKEPAAHPQRALLCISPDQYLLRNVPLTVLLLSCLGWKQVYSRNSTRVKSPPNHFDGLLVLASVYFPRPLPAKYFRRYVGLTAVFGMGTGVPPPPSTPTMGTPLTRCSVWVSFRRLAPPVGLEPTTFRLTAERSTD